ncbi:MAG: 2-succinyl-6-hydroxy-2,4-cyclohexadiene-1-carboxylate synthase [Deltaproteobacteria bacterium]|nr:2-succinyl-6-hydroxy-2,4-cyclohexadiene-1-carboxylate synthase [Deltaproteobacteria bacterium]
MAFLDVGGLRLRVEREGPRGESALVALHGFTGTAEELLAPARRLSDIERIGVDLIGHGQSDAPADPARYGFEQAIQDLVKLLERLERPSVELWGYSQGGRLALAFALAHPKRVTRLILESASPGIESESERTVRRHDDETLAQFIEREGIEAFVARWEALPLFASERELPPEARAELRRSRLSQRAVGLANALRGLGTGTQPSFWPRLHELGCPTLLITGARDEKFHAIAQGMSQQLPNSRHISIADAGHAPHRERPAACVAAVAEFLFARKP